MNLWTMIFLVVVVIMFTELAKTNMKIRSKGTPSADLEDVYSQLEKVVDHLQDLEKRLQNVETITTAKDYELNQKFKDLKSS